MGYLKAGIAIAAVAGILAGCADREEILEGTREDLRAPLRSGEVLASETSAAALPSADSAQPFRPPRAVVNTAWTHRAGDVDNSVPHPALSATPTRAWSVDIGQGNSRGHRITADPVVADGRIFTLDSRALVTAVSANGQRLWSRDVTPLGEDADDASGGGLAVAGGRVFATSGFGRVVALDAATGEEIWSQVTGAASSTAPTVYRGVVYTVGRDSRAWALDADTGRILWEFLGTPSVSAIAGAAAPAVTDRLAIFPMPSGELIGTLRQSGLRVWAAPVSGAREGRVYTRFTDVTGDPVVVGSVIYAGNPAGRTIAIEAGSGERIWTAPEGAMSPVQVAGGSVFLISDQNELVRLNAATGGRIWGTELPLFQPTRRESRRKAIYPHFGPLLAGGRLYVASGDGLLRVFDPETGGSLGEIDLPGGAAALPAAAGQTLYIVSGEGQLHAFR